MRNAREQCFDKCSYRKNINWKIKSIIRITMGIAAISLSIYFGVQLSLLYF
jgi:hypothetical protein